MATLRDLVEPTGSPAQRAWPTTDWQDVRRGMRPSNLAHEANTNLNALVMSLLRAPSEVVHAIAHPTKAFRGVEHDVQANAANNVKLLHDIYNPALSPHERQQAQDALVSRMAMLGIVKAPGGNWMTGSASFEPALDDLKFQNAGEASYMREVRRLYDAGDSSFSDWISHKVRSEPSYINRDALTTMNEFRAEHGLPPLGQDEPHVAINRWVDQKLRKYMYNDMGTPRDPVRALAEKGILHFDPEATYSALGNQARQAADSFVRTPQPDSPGTRLGKSLLAQRWENAADASILPRRVGDVLASSPKDLERMPWLGKLDSESPVYASSRSAVGHRLGFPHLVDELNNSLRPPEINELPRELRLTPAQLDKTSVPDAVRLVHKINAWREKQALEASAGMAKNPATHVLKEYDTVPGTQLPNDKGLHWVELKDPQDLPQNWTKRGGNVAGPEGAVAIEGSVNDPRQQALQQALKYEGDRMGHCVGGYCDSVSSGKSRIFSLRDAKGVPHVTIETRPWVEDLYQSMRRSERGEPEPAPGHPQIVQIKGKANRAPNDEYLPFVQDFVRTQGPWSRVGDIGNAGMRPSEHIFNENERRVLKEAGAEPPAYLTPDQADQFHAIFEHAMRGGDPTWVPAAFAQALGEQ